MGGEWGWERPPSDRTIYSPGIRTYLLAGLGEADVGPGAEPEVAGASVHADALSPGLGEVTAGGTLDAEGETAGAASVVVASGLLYGCHKAGGEPVGSFHDGFLVPREVF